MSPSLPTCSALCAAFLAISTAFAAPPAELPFVGEDVVFEEADGALAVEAEHFFRQTHDSVRRWYLTTATLTPGVGPDGDPNHATSASGGAYLEILPDTRRSDGDKLISGQNFSNDPGKMAVLYYNVHIASPGRYYVWARIFSTNTEDNGLHVGIDGAWPESGCRMQWTAKQKWHWDSKQRTTRQHGGEKHKLFLDIDTPGAHCIMFSMREDGTEFDKWMLVREQKQSVAGPGPEPRVKSGTLPPPFPVPEGALPPPSPGPQAASPAQLPPRTTPASAATIRAVQFPVADNAFYIDRAKWLAINPDTHKNARTAMAFPFETGTYHLTFHAVGEDDGRSSYEVTVGDRVAGRFTSPLAKETYEEGPEYTVTWRDVAISKGEVVAVSATIGSKNGEDHSRGRWSKIVFARADGRPMAQADIHAPSPLVPVPSGPPLHGPRQPDGDGTVTLSGELKQWHNVTLTIAGPFAHELDRDPNPFTDYRLEATFQHEEGGHVYRVPGYFAADGNAADTSADAGTAWRVHFRPDRVGEWNYRIRFVRCRNAAVVPDSATTPVAGIDGKTGTFAVSATDKTGRDFRAKGRLEYAGKHYLRFAGTGEYFLKQGADAPENFLAYADFDGDFKSDGVKDNLIKTWEPHIRDWGPGDPVWGDGRGKGIIGALNYLASEEMNAVSFLTMNIGGDDRNVFPYTSYDERRHLDCSKLDQWAIVLEHAQRRGLFLHFKTQETENETLLDNGDTGPERSLYYRELIARFGHHLALNWNLGEEDSDQTDQQRRDMARYFAENDPYRHLLVIHTYPGAKSKIYTPLLGDKSEMTGASLQGSHATFGDVHRDVLTWVTQSAAAGKPWVVACDEPGNASDGLIPDGDNADSGPGNHLAARHQALWGTFMAGGCGNEWYFGYKHAHSDLTCQDWRSRDQWWDQCRIAMRLFRDHAIPFHEMTNANALVGNAGSDATAYCFAKPGELYLVYLAPGKTASLDLTDATGEFTVSWFSPRVGGNLLRGSVTTVKGGAKQDLGTPPTEAEKDWLVLIRR